MSNGEHPEFAEIRYGDKIYKAPVTVGSEGEVGIDISKLRAELGIITMDPGYANTGACQSAITFIDGEQGILRFRGYPIEDLAENSTFLEVAWLLLHGELPTQAQYDEWVFNIQHHSMLHEDFRRVYQGLPKDGPPMAVLSAVSGALATYYQDHLDPQDAKATDITIIRLMAKMPTIAAWCFKTSIGQPFIYPDNSLRYASNFLHMMFATPCEPYTTNPVAARALDLLLLLHADHEQNCSTSTVRLTGSSLSTMFSSISAGIGALWGRLHGGANQAVLEMLDYIEKHENGDPQAFVEKVKNKTSGIRLMGFGHRVYKNYDPRAQIIRKACREVLDELGVQSKLLEIAVKLEEIALNDEYFVSRKLYPNVDFYSGLIYKAIGIPTNMFTVLFALGRLPGWIAQWCEMHRDPAFRIGRPRQIYTGEQQRAYVPIEQR